MKRILFLAITLLLLIGCEKKDSPAKDDLWGTKWTSAYGSGNEKHYVLEFMEPNKAVMYLESLGGDVVSDDVHNGTYKRDGDQITFIGLEYYTELWVTINLYVDHMIMDSASLNGNFMEVSYTDPSINYQGKQTFKKQ